MSEERKHFDPMEIIKEILAFAAVCVISYGWMLIMLLIVSFVFLSVFTILFEDMLIYSGIFTAIVACVYIIKRIKKKRR